MALMRTESLYRYGPGLQGFSGHCARRLLMQVKSVLPDSLIFQGRITTGFISEVI